MMHFLPQPSLGKGYTVFEGGPTPIWFNCFIEGGVDIVMDPSTSSLEVVSFENPLHATQLLDAEWDDCSGQASTIEGTNDGKFFELGNNVLFEEEEEKVDFP